MKMAPVEREILARSTGLGHDRHKHKPLRQLMDRVQDVDFLIDMAIREGLVCMLFRNLQKSGALDALSHVQRQRLQSLYYQTLAHNLQLIHDLKEILNALNKKGIDVVPVSYTHLRAHET